MRVTSIQAPLEKIETEVLVVPLTEEEAKNPPEEIKNLFSENKYQLAAKEFAGKLYETFYIPSKNKLLLVGVGTKTSFDSRLARNVAGVAARRLVKMGFKKIAYDARLYPDPGLIVEGIGLGEYDPGLYKSKNKKEQIEDLVIIGNISKETLNKAHLIVENTNWIRNLVNEPANKLTPKILVETVKKFARELKLELEIIDEKEAARRGMGAFLGISQGSHEPSFLLILKHIVDKKKPIFAAVGKGITFDSGGISIKPSEKMHEMKMDMAGAAAALAFVRLAAQLKLGQNIIAVTPITENLPGGGALKPGDVVKSSSGKTIEVINTDAEGRVVLADGLTLAQKEGATILVDLATLTGAAIVALGSEATALLGNEQEFIDQIKKAGEEAGERMWQLPIYPEHQEMLKSDVADVANIPPVRGAGVIAGAVFLQEFIEPKNTWAHLDIAGTAWNDFEKPYIAKGATGVGLRTLLNLVENKN